MDPTLRKLTGGDRRSLGRVNERIITWLMKGDAAIRWQTMRDLLEASPREWRKERKQVAEAGWGARLLAKQRPDGHWGRAFYQPKWTCTTYTMQVLRRLGLPPRHPAALEACRLYLEYGIGQDGGINFWKPRKMSETCVTGMVLSQLAYFMPRRASIDGIVDHLLEEQMDDSGWNCRRWDGAVHSSFHTTTNVLEGLQEYIEQGGRKSAEAECAAAKGREFLLEHGLFRSSTTGKVVDARMTRATFPPRWHHDVLRALDHFQQAGAARDPRLTDAVELVLKRRNKDGRWSLPAPYKGAVFFEMEKPGRPSRWNTLRALRVLAWWQ